MRMDIVCLEYRVAGVTTMVRGGCKRPSCYSLRAGSTDMRVDGTRPRALRNDRQSNNDYSSLHTRLCTKCILCRHGPLLHSSTSPPT